MGYIYMIKNRINGKVYIGQTIRPIKKRLEEHRTGRGRCRGIYNAIKKHRWENFEIDWYECPDEDLNFDEELLVREMGTLSPNGYNLMEGGGSGGKRSEEANKRNRETHLGKVHSKQTKQNISKGIKGKPKSKEHIQNISGEKHHKSKRVYQYDLDGTFVNLFGSCGEATRYLNKKNDGTHINRCAYGVKERKTAYNFKWSYTFPFM